MLLLLPFNDIGTMYKVALLHIRVQQRVFVLCMSVAFFFFFFFSCCSMQRVTICEYPFLSFFFFSFFYFAILFRITFTFSYTRMHMKYKMLNGTLNMKSSMTATSLHFINGVDSFDFFFFSIQLCAFFL